MSGIITNFGHFLWSGSFNPDLEKKLDGLNWSANVEDIAEGNFRHDNYTFMDTEQLVAGMQSDLNEKLTVEIPYRESARISIVRNTPVVDSDSEKPYTAEVHKQVTLKCPNTAYYTKRYELFSACAWIGEYGIATALTIKIAFVIFSMIKNKSIAALSSRNISLLVVGLMGLGAFWRCANRADFLCRRIQRIDSDAFTKYAKNVQLKREELFKVKKASDSSSSRSYSVYSGIENKKVVVSPSEKEIIKLLEMQKKLADSNRWISGFLGSDDLKKLNEPALTPEMQAINAYLLELSASEWIKTTTEALKTIILSSSLASREYCAEALVGEIPSTFSIENCLDGLSPDVVKKVAEHLKTYLDARFKRDQNAHLPTKDDLAELISPTKEKVRVKMLEIVVDTYKIPLKDIRGALEADPSWKQTGLTPDLTWAKSE